MLFSVIWSTLVYAEDNSGFKANTNHQQEYFDNDYAMNRQQQYWNNKANPFKDNQEVQWINATYAILTS